MDLEINGEPVEIQMQLDDEGDVSKQVTQLYYTVHISVKSLFWT